MTSPLLLILLRIIHIGAGVFWVGGVNLLAWFVLPGIRALGPAGAPVTRELMQVRRVPLRMLVSGWVTVLAGFALYYRDGSLGGPSFYASRAGMAFGAGGAIALLVVLMGTFVNLPTAKRMSAVAEQLQGGATSELTNEMQRLQLRMKRLIETAAVLLLLATIAMAVARFL